MKVRISDSDWPVKGNATLIVVHVTKIHIHIFLRNKHITTLVCSTNTWHVKNEIYVNHTLTRKRGNCECITTRDRLTPRQSFPASITTPCQVWSRWTYPLPYYSIFAADTLLFAVTLTFDLWPWTFAVYCLQWRDKTFNQIWIQSSYSRRSYCEFYIWLNDFQLSLIDAAKAV